ncbi:hypothetical protein CR513_22134, partial [Mucuna pruriens]
MILRKPVLLALSLRPFCEEAPLLLKLWGYFAEFHRESCLAPLCILYLPTCALTHPPWTNLAEEPLGFGGIGFSPNITLLKSTFSLPLHPPLLAQVLPSKEECSLY